MSNRYIRAALCGAAVVLVTTAARGHEIVGNRMFPATLAIDDPGVADELSLPTISRLKTGDDPTVKEFDISGEYSKRSQRILPSRFLRPGRISMRPAAR